VNVKTRIAVVADRNVADRAQDFALFGDLDFLVSLLLDFEPADGGFLECTDSSQGCRGNSGFVREFRQCRKRFFARSNITTRVSSPATPATFMLFMIVKPRCAAYGGLP
jgi:hypothetical protein